MINPAKRIAVRVNESRWPTEEGKIYYANRQESYIEKKKVVFYKLLEYCLLDMFVNVRWTGVGLYSEIGWENPINWGRQVNGPVEYVS